MQAIPEQVTEIPSIEERIARAYRYAMATGENRAAHTCEHDYYSSPGLWRDGMPSAAMLRTAELRRQRLARIARGEKE